MQVRQATPTYVNDSATSSPTRTGLAQPRSRPVRCRLIGRDGTAYPAFQLKPDAFLTEILDRAFPGQGDYEIEAA